MSARRVMAWATAAVLGLALAAAITLAASQLSSQRIGLSGEPSSAGDQLVPRSARRPALSPASDDRAAPRQHAKRRAHADEREARRDSDD